MGLFSKNNGKGNNPAPVLFRNEKAVARREQYLKDMQDPRKAVKIRAQQERDVAKVHRELKERGYPRDSKKR